MLAIQVQSKLQEQARLSGQIQSAFSDLIAVGQENLSKQRVSIYINELEQNWDEFSVNHKSISLCLIKLTDPERDVVQETEYFTDNLYTFTRHAYLTALEKMTVMKDQMNITTRGPTNGEPQVISTISYGNRLPILDLPKFNGHYANWLNFKDMFESIVLNNPSLSAIEKLHYLKTSLIGPAASILKHTASTADNLDTAWSTVVSRYNNSRELIDSTLHSLFSLKRLTKESANDLDQLYNTIKQHLRTLEMLKLPVEHWDAMIVYHIVQRLDPSSVRAWQLHVGPATQYPTMKQLGDFLTTRIRSLSAFERSTTLKPIFQQNTTSHHVAAPLTKQKGSNKSISKSNNAIAKSVCCGFCSKNHLSHLCPDYVNKTVQQKTAFIKERNLCFNCLGSHRVGLCSSSRRCFKCGKKHHTTIHSAETTSTKSVLKVQNNSEPVKQVNHVATNKQLLAPSVILATALITVESSSGHKATVRVLIDQGSEISLMSEYLAERLQVSRQSKKLVIIGVGATSSGKSHGLAEVKVKPHFPSPIQFNVAAYILPKLTTRLPSSPANVSNWSHLKGIKLADPEFMTPGPIDMILGADVYNQIIQNDLIKGDIDQPIAQLTVFGYIISGPSKNTRSSQDLQSYHITIDHQLTEILERFWYQEEITPKQKKLLNALEAECEKHFEDTHSRDNTGRYIVKLPFKKPINELGDSRPSAFRMINHLKNKFSQNQNYYTDYLKFLKEYEELKHMIRVPDNEIEPVNAFYLPHHGVIRESSSTTRLRVVFNGSTKVVNGLPLNELLHSGPKLQVDLFDVLLWFRKFKFIFSADIEKMYRQIQIHPDDWRYQRILWLDNDKIAKYELTTVTYGLACAPYLALKCLSQLIKDEGSKFPLAIDVLTKGRYVDDIFGGSDSIKEAKLKAGQVYALCMAGGFPLKKWISNDPNVLQEIPSNCQITKDIVSIDDGSIHALGLSWRPKCDTLSFNFKSSESKKYTKRTILSKIAQFFDPLGFLSPLFILAKVFMQNLWKKNLNWDEALPKPLIDEWLRIQQSLEFINEIQIPRWIGWDSSSRKELHGFCDASKAAMACVIYLKAANPNGTYNISMLCSKTKVAPVKHTTIPRLELLAAVLLTKLMTVVIKTLEFNDIPYYLWTDSSIVHTWLNGHPSKWKEYVHNRVCYIQETLPDGIWRHISGLENPADCATRGLTSLELKNHSLWWSGPSWLTLESSEWPKMVPCNSFTTNELEQKVKVHHVRTSSGPWDLLNRYQSLSTLLRITCCCFRVIRRFKHITNSSVKDPLTPEELEEANKYWVKAIQTQTYPHTIEALMKKLPLSSSNPLIRLTPIIDEDGLLRVGGRLNNSDIGYNLKHPYILPKESYFSTLVIRDAHYKTLHGSTRDTLHQTRTKYWIVGGRVPVKTILSKCITCTRHRKNPMKQLIGQLPSDRVTPSRAFLHTGVDYAGPFTIKTWRGKNTRTYKAWVALFVCHATSAIHLELVTAYSTDAFIAAFKRFTSRRGICATLRSDCGTNLVGADKELQSMFKDQSKELKEIASIIANDGTKWLFNPPSGPHFGGQWEAGVKSMKYHLKRVVGNHLLTYEEMNTLLTQIEAVLNSRPLCPLTEDPNDLQVLTPGHFLIGQALSLVPESNLETIHPNRLDHWRHLTQMTQSFWSKWSKEYLQKLQTSYKWNQPTASINKGSLVLIMDERYRAAKWPLGRVEDTHPGADGLVRVVTVRTATSSFKRPITKLCLLPIDINSLPPVNEGGR